MTFTFEANDGMTLSLDGIDVFAAVGYTLR